MDYNNLVFAGMPGGWEVALIALVILLIFGAKRLPGLARGLGQGIREFKGAVDGLEDELLLLLFRVMLLLFRCLKLLFNAPVD